MSDRRDKKGRILRQGESQRADGMYMYRYTDSAGKRHTVYSWRLTSTDRIPANKKETPALRDLEKEIAKDLEDEIDTTADITLDQAFDEMMQARQDLRKTTRKNYMTLYEVMVKDRIGSRQLRSIRHSDLQKLYTALATEDNYAKSSILSVHNILLQIFRQAVYDHRIRYNPALKAFVVISRSDLCPPVEKKKALTKSQQSALIDYVYGEQSLRVYGNLLTVLLGTGMRIGECIGLRECDCDFEAGVISVNHALTYKNTEDQQYHFLITKPKTAAGFRTIPMFPEVKQALLQEIERARQNQQTIYSVDGYDHFIFMTSKGTPLRASFVYEMLQRVTRDYNAQENATASLEQRAPSYLPHLSPHILRHTFCTRLCECEPNIKVIQEVMGHKKCTTTMDVYNDALGEELQANFSSMEGKIKLTSSAVV